MGLDEQKDTIAYMNGKKIGIVKDFQIGKEVLLPIEDLTKAYESLSGSFELLIENSKPLIYWLKKICNEDYKARHYFRTRAKRRARGKR